MDFETVSLADIAVFRCTKCQTPRLRAWCRLPCTKCGADAVHDLVPTQIAVALAALEPPDEYQAAEVLFHLRFGGDWQCVCGHRRCTHLRSRPRVFVCNACDHAFSVTAGTSLHRCRVPLVKVVVAARLLAGSEASISARRLARELDLGIESAWSLGHRLRSGFLDLSPARLTAPVALSTCVVVRRPLPRQKFTRSFLQRRSFFTVLWDRNLRAVAIPGRLDPHSARRFVDRHADADRAAVVPAMLFEDHRRISDKTHHGVTDRWLPLYAAAIVGWQNAASVGAPAYVATLAATLRSRRFPFARLRPRDAPEPDLRAWAPSLADVDALMAEWGRTPPPPTGSACQGACGIDAHLPH